MNKRETQHPDQISHDTIEVHRRSTSVSSRIDLDILHRQEVESQNKSIPPANRETTRENYARGGIQALLKFCQCGANDIEHEIAEESKKDTIHAEITKVDIDDYFKDKLLSLVEEKKYYPTTGVTGKHPRHQSP